MTASGEGLTPILMSQSNELISVVDQSVKGDSKKRRIEVVDESSGLEGFENGLWMNREEGQKWSVVYNKITRHRDGSMKISNLSCLKLLKMAL